MNNNNKYDYDDFDDDESYEMDLSWFDYDCDLNEHKTKDKVKWIMTAVAFALIAVMLVITCLQVFGSGKVKPSEWFGGNTEENASLVITPTDEEYSAMRLSTARTAESGGAYTVKATVTPSAAQNKQVAWSIAWKDGSSAWASGKNVEDYITMTSNYVSATVECKAPFGEQAIITAQIKNDASISATCTVDYKQKYFGTSAYLSTYGQYDTSFSTTHGNEDKVTVTVQDSLVNVYGTGSVAFYLPKFVPVMSRVYTIPLESAATFKYCVKLGDEYKKAIDNYNAYMDGCSLTYPQYWNLFAEASTDNVHETETVPFDNPDGYDNVYVSAFLAKLCPEVEKSKGVFSDEQYPFFLGTLNSVANNPSLTGTDKFQFYVRIEAIVDGVTYTDTHMVFVNNCNIKANGLSLDQSALEF